MTQPRPIIKSSSSTNESKVQNQKKTCAKNPLGAAENNMSPVRSHAKDGSLRTGRWSHVGQMGEEERPDIPAPFPPLPTKSFWGSPFLTGRSSITNKDAMVFLDACRAGDEQVLRTLVKKRLPSTTINMVDHTGKTGLSHICTAGHTGMLEAILITPGIDANLADSEGNTPLHFAAQAGNADIVTLLLNHFKNVDVDARNHSGLTPLMKAALQGKTKCCKLLLLAGASSVMRDPARGFCAEEWATFCGRQSASQAIRSLMKTSSASSISSASSKKRKNQSLALQHVAAMPPVRKMHYSAALERWTSEPDLQIPPSPPAAAANPNLPGQAPSSTISNTTTGGWITKKLHKVFRRLDTQHGYSLARNLSSSALCASSLVPSATLIDRQPLANNATINKKTFSKPSLPAKRVIPEVLVTDNHSDHTSDLQIVGVAVQESARPNKPTVRPSAATSSRLGSKIK